MLCKRTQMHWRGLSDLPLSSRRLCFASACLRVLRRRQLPIPDPRSRQRWERLVNRPQRQACFAHPAMRTTLMLGENSTSGVPNWQEPTFWTAHHSCPPARHGLGVRSKCPTLPLFHRYLHETEIAPLIVSGSAPGAAQLDESKRRSSRARICRTAFRFGCRDS
jgi:hypothetical protein